MKFINYGIPLGLGINNYNSISHNTLNYNGITKQKDEYSDDDKEIQIGGNHYGMI